MYKLVFLGAYTPILLLLLRTKKVSFGPLLKNNICCFEATVCIAYGTICSIISIADCSLHLFEAARFSPYR